MRKPADRRVIACALLSGRLALLTFDAVADPAAPAEAVAGAAPEASGLFRSGLELVDQGLYREALAQFEAAYALQPRFQVLYNIASLQRLLGMHRESRDTFTRYLVEGGDAIAQERHAEVDRLIAAESVLAERAQPAPAKNAAPAPTVAPAVAAPPAPADVAVSERATSDHVPASPPLARSRIAPWLAGGAAALGVAALTMYAWNHARWQDWRVEDRRLDTTPVPIDDGERRNLESAQARNDERLSSIHAVQTANLIVAGASLTAAAAAVLLWARGRANDSIAVIAPDEHLGIAAQWRGRF